MLFEDKISQIFVMEDEFCMEFGVEFGVEIAKTDPYIIKARRKICINLRAYNG